MSLHTKNTNYTRETLKTSLFTDISLTVGSEEDMATRWWDTILDENITTLFVDMTVLMKHKNIVPIMSW